MRNQPEWRWAVRYEMVGTSLREYVEYATEGASRDAAEEYDGEVVQIRVRTPNP